MKLPLIVVIVLFSLVSIPVFSLGSIQPEIPSVDVPKFLVALAVGCTSTAISTDADCWSLTSGGSGGAGVPDSDDTTFIDAASGLAASMDAALVIGDLDMTGYTGVLTTAGFDITSTIGNLRFVGTVLASTSDVVSALGFLVFGTTTFTAGTMTSSSLTVQGILNSGSSPIAITSSFAQGTAGDLNIGTSVVTLSSGSILNNNVGNPMVLNNLILNGGPSFFSNSFDVPSQIRTANVTTAGASSVTLRINDADCGPTWLINAGSSIMGSLAAPLVITREECDGTPSFWGLVAGAGVTASYVNVSNSNASGGATIDATDGTNIDFGGNTNWNFGIVCTVPLRDLLNVIIPLLVALSILLVLLSVFVIKGSHERSGRSGNVGLIIIVVNVSIILILAVALLPRLVVC